MYVNHSLLYAPFHLQIALAGFAVKRALFQKIRFLQKQHSFRRKM